MRGADEPLLNRGVGRGFVCTRRLQGRLGSVNQFGERRSRKRNGTKLYQKPLHESSKKKGFSIRGKGMRK